jgi:hypothetical protein
MIGEIRDGSIASSSTQSCPSIKVLTTLDVVRGVSGRAAEQLTRSEVRRRSNCLAYDQIDNDDGDQDIIHGASRGEASACRLSKSFAEEPRLETTRDHVLGSREPLRLVTASSHCLAREFPTSADDPVSWYCIPAESVVIGSKQLSCSHHHSSWLLNRQRYSAPTSFVVSTHRTILVPFLMSSPGTTAGIKLTF